MAALGRLAIAVEADIAKFTSDMGRADRVAKRTAQEMERSLNRGFAAIGAAATVAGLAIAAMVKRSIDAADESAKMAQRIGVSVEALGGLRHAADQTGVSVQQLQTGLTRVARSAADAAGGLKQQQAVWQALGISVTDAAGNLRSTEAIFGDVAEQFSRMEDGAAKTALATRIFGRAGAELIPMLNLGRAGLGDMAKEARALGIVLDTETAKAAEVFNDNLSKLQQGVVGLSNDLMSAFLPSLVEATNAAVAWVKQLRESGVIDEVVEKVKAFIRILDDLAVFIITKMVAQALVGFVANLAILAKAMTSAATGAALLRGGMMALAGPIGVLATLVAGLVTWYYSKARAETETERASRLLEKATRDAAEAVDRMAGATKKQVQEELNKLVVTQKSIQQQLDLAQANLAVAESEAQIANQRERMVGAQNRGRGIGMEYVPPTGDPGEAYANLDAARERLVGLKAELQGSKLAYEGLVELLNQPIGGSSGAPIVQFGNDAAAVNDELAKLMEASEKFANTTIATLTERFNPLLAIQLQYEESLRELAPLLQGTAEQQLLYAEAVAALARAKEEDVRQTRYKIQQEAASRDIIGELNRDYAQQVKMLGMSRRELVGYQAATRAAAHAQQILGAELEDMPGKLEKIMKVASDKATALYDMDEAARGLEDILSRFDEIGFEGLVREIQTVKEALEDATDPATIVRLERALGSLRQEGLQSLVGASQQVLGSIQRLSKEGSSAYKAMEVASQALNVVLAIGAILNQGKGDPWTAFARMAAMAVAVSGLVGSISANFGGGFTDTAAERQATQGTGTVLGDADAKSESIANAIQITADATSELVGINRGMLNALIALQSGIGSATGMLARGAGRAEFGPGVQIQRFGDLIGAGPLAGLIDPLRILGGSSRITDRGIMIGGGGVGSLNPMAYQEEQYRTWRFGSRRTREQTASLPGNVAAQFDLIMDSIVSTVREAATALGLVPEEIEAAIAAYEVAVTRISLEDLSAEEQQAELEAVFSSIFDGLAGSVVPFIEQFQQVGEGLGETLVRVATGVQVMQEAVRRLGFSLDETDPERFAQASEALIELSGGLEGFISGMSSFLDKFATDAHRFAVAQDELNRAFEQAGMTVPATRDEMWALMQSLDATTESGREQIATLLRLADVADEYYRLLERRGSLEEMFVNMRRGDWSKPMQDLFALEDAMRGALESASALGASEMELAMIRRYYTRQLRALTQQIMSAAMDIARQLGYIAPLASQGLQDIELGGINQVEQAVEDRYARELALLQQLDEYVRGLGISALSPLTPAERLGEAESEYMRLLTLAQGGDLDALAQLQGAADAYLREAQGFYGGVGAYQGIFDAVRGQLGALVAAGPQSQPIGPQTPVFGGPVTVEPGSGWAEQNAMERAMLAQQLVDYIAALSVALGESVADIMETLGIPMAQLVEDLGINIENITGASVEALAQLAYDLGIPLGELVAAIGLDLPDLADGVRELAYELGIDLGDLSTATAGALADLANDLGVDLDDLTDALGIDLGRLTDANSPIFLALAETIDQLSPAIRDQLGPLLAAITAATSEADANEAIAEMATFINANLPAGIRNLLAPYFADVFPAGALTDLDYLGSIDGRLITTNGWLEDIAFYLENQSVGDVGDVSAPSSSHHVSNIEVGVSSANESLRSEIRDLKERMLPLLDSIAKTNADMRNDERMGLKQSRRVG